MMMVQSYTPVPRDHLRTCISSQGGESYVAITLAATGSQSARSKLLCDCRRIQE